MLLYPLAIFHLYSRSEELFIYPRYFFTFTVTVKNQGVDAGLAPQVRITAQKGLQRANEVHKYVQYIWQ